ncbi:MAG TPA: protein kinase [Steroidobacteraceae bacterium]|nr:protein kinase [Steroidobacteraceae bacterium]
MSGMKSGQQLSGRYSLRERLSAGPLGETWRAHDATLDREVIIRLLPAPTDPAALQSANAELQAARHIDAGTLATAHGIERDGEHAFLVRDYIPGTDLASLRAGSWRAIAPAAANVAEDLARLHQAGLVHRDVKPSNVILRPDSTATLIDFGAAALDGAVAPRGALSRYSASPQQLAGEPASPADDAYGLGALLYELLSGYPPFYPNFTRERALSEPVAPLKAAQPAPQALLDLIMSLLAKSPAARPADLGQVARQLRDLAQTAEEVSITPSRSSSGAAAAPVVTIVRPILRQNAHSERMAAATSRPQHRWMISAAFAVLVILAISVFVFLPNLVQKPATPVKTPAAAANAPAPKPAEPAEVDLRSLAEQMQEAEQVRDVYDALYESLDKRAVTEWAAQPFAAAAKHGEEARKQFAAREFKAAKESYSAGVEELHKAADLAEPTLRAQIEKGEAALVAGQSAAAQAAFNLALKIEPGNATATKGLKRAGTLDQVNALLASAAGEERSGQPPLAVQHYEEASKLDPDTTAARDGAARVRARISGDQFAAAMAQGLAQLSAGKLGPARSAFERAKALRPGAPEVADALAQVSHEELRLSVAQHREQAEKFERAERWGEALAEYDAALKLDSGLEYARTGHDRTAPRAEMARQLTALINQPDRLLAAAVRDQTRALLAAANKIDPQGPVLRQQIATVSANIARFEAPVRVALESDNQTRVVIHRVGELGAFDHREIDLQPGTYTVMGTRVGYRDVRREITVVPGKALPPLVVRCEDRI